MSDRPSDLEAAGKQSQHYESTQHGVLNVWEGSFTKDPTTDLGSSLQEMI
jgi:hypothetical protein